MKHNWTVVIAVIFVLVFSVSIRAQSTWQPTGDVKADKKIVHDKLLSITTAYPATSRMLRFVVSKTNKETARDRYGREILGVVKYGDKTFDYGLSMRVSDNPTDSIPMGQQWEKCTSLKITPHKDLLLRLYYRRQGKAGSESTISNDGKDLKLVNISNFHEVVEAASFRTKPLQKSLHDYCIAEKVYKLPADNTFVLWCKGTTVLLYAVEYMEIAKIKNDEGN